MVKNQSFCLPRKHDVRLQNGHFLEFELAILTCINNFVNISILQCSCHFHFQTTFEESRLNEADVGDKQKWLKEMDCNLLYWNGKVFSISLSDYLLSN